MVIVPISDEDAEAEEIGQAGSSPELPAPAKPCLQLLAEGFDGTAPSGGALPLSIPIMKVIPVGLKIRHLPHDSGFGFRCASGVGIEQLLQATQDPRLLPTTQVGEHRLQPRPGFSRSDTMLGIGHGLEVFARMVEVERLDGPGEAIGGQIPQPNSAVHDQIDPLGSRHPRREASACTAAPKRTGSVPGGEATMNF